MNPIPAGTDVHPGFWASVWNSATSFQFYRQIQDQRLRRTLLYLVGWAVGLSLLLSWRMHHDYSRSLSDWAQWLSATLPDIKIENGVATVASEKPKSISDGTAILILDTTDKPQEIGEKFRTGMVLAKDKVILKWNQVGGPVGDVSRLEKLIYACAYMATMLQPQSFHGNQFDLSWIRSLVINPKTIDLWKESVSRWMGITLPVLYLIFYLVGKLLQAFFFSLVLATSQRSLKENGMTYARVLNLAVYALTPPAIFAAAVQIAGLQVPYMEWIFLGMYVAFLMGAMNACLPKRPSPEPDPDSEDIDF